MSFVFKARVLLELGAELISSDAVALYELIKNGVDAGSKRVSIDVLIVLQPSSLRALEEQYVNSDSYAADDFLEDVSSHIAEHAPAKARAALLARIGKPKTAKAALLALREAVFEANTIRIVDQGHGMTKSDLQSCYLTVGTPMRLHQRNAAIASAGRKSPAVPLGEKGIGRLAAMRIGHHVEVITGVAGEQHSSRLLLDWRPVFKDPNLDASALDFKPQRHAPKKPRSSGTEIIIRDLQSDWTPDKLLSLSETELAKLADPFKNNLSGEFVALTYQGSEFIVEGFPSHLLRHADASCEIEYRVVDEKGKSTSPRLTVSTRYSYYNRDETLVHEGAHLQNIVSHEVKGRTQKFKDKNRLADAAEVVAALRSLGPFSARFHWFNRGRIKQKNAKMWTDSLEGFIRRWSGGLLVYRDGFRVYPYGSAGDDWLDLDRKALAASAYKLNRAQIVGYLRITSKDNPALHDQTNREGFRDTPEKEALRRLLRQAIISDCRTFLEKVDRENKALDANEFNEIDARISNNQRSALEKLRDIRQRAPQEANAINEVMEQLAEVEDAWERAKQALKAHDSEIERYIHLAGVGLMVELIAHELARSTDEALQVLGSKKTADSPALLDVLKSQILTVNRRVRVLDQLSIPGRQRKYVHAIPELVELIAEFYEAKIARHGITLRVIPEGRGAFKHRVEKGQILQILDNLLSNAVYWLDRRIDRRVKPEIRITIDATHHTVTILDNGPGIPESTGERVFDAFYTTKSEDGRGLGLFIARRLCADNDMTLRLLPPVGGLHNGFEIVFTGE